MPEADDNFLPGVIGILNRLCETSADRGNAMLSFLLDLARREAQDELASGRVHATAWTSFKQSGTLAAMMRTPGQEYGHLPLQR